MPTVEFTVHDAKRHEDWGPVCDPAECKHSGSSQIPLNVRPGKNVMHADAVFCADCGRELLGAMPWGEAFSAMIAETPILSIRVRMWEVGSALAKSGRIVPQLPDDADDFTRRLHDERNLAPASAFVWGDAA